MIINVINELIRVHTDPEYWDDYYYICAWNDALEMIK